MKVSELIAFLQTQPQDLQVVYACYSEYCLLDSGEIKVEPLCLPRPDGWVHCYRKDMPSQDYLCFPGN